MRMKTKVKMTAAQREVRNYVRRNGADAWKVGYLGKHVEARTASLNK